MIFIPYTEENYKTANSYLSISEADELLNDQRQNETWINLENEVKEVLLIKASQLVDSAFMYQGIKISDEQLLKFPRRNVDISESEADKKIPLGAKMATVSLCLKFTNDEAFKNVTMEHISKLTKQFKVIDESGLGDDVICYLKQYKARTVRIGVR